MSRAAAGLSSQSKSAAFVCTDDAASVFVQPFASSAVCRKRPTTRARRAASAAASTPLRAGEGFSSCRPVTD